MLDIEKIDRESTELIRSFTREQLLEFMDWYHQEIALAKKEERMARKAAMTGTTIGKINGSPSAMVNSKGAPVKKLVRTTKIRAKTKTTADSL